MPDGTVESARLPEHDPGMEARVSALESDTGAIKAVLARLEPLLGRMDNRLSHIDERLRRIETEALPKLARIETEALPKLSAEVAELRGKLSQLPTTIQVFTYMIGLLGFAIALGGAVFGMARYFLH